MYICIYNSPKGLIDDAIFYDFETEFVQALGTSTYRLYLII